MIKQTLRKWLFSEEVKLFEEKFKEIDRLSEAQEFFIKLGKYHATYVCNNPELKRIPTNLTGHGIPLAEKHLSSNRNLSRKWKNEQRCWVSRVNKPYRMARNKLKIVRGE